AETALRVEELGVALAYWAAYYRTLPGTPRLAGTLDLGDALLGIPLFLSGQARPGVPRGVYLRVMQAHGAECSEAVQRRPSLRRPRPPSALSPRPGRVCIWRTRPVSPSYCCTRSRHRPRCAWCCLTSPAGCARRHSPTSGKTSRPPPRPTATKRPPSATI